MDRILQNSVVQTAVFSDSVLQFSSGLSSTGERDVAQR